MKNNWKSCLIAAVALIAVATIHAQSSGTYTVHNLTVGGTATGSFGGGGSGTFQSVITDLDASVSTHTATDDLLTIAAGRCMGTNKSASTIRITAGSGSGSYVAYCTDSQTIVVEHSTSAGLTVTASGLVPLQVTTPAIPEGMVPIATGTITSGAWGAPTDARDWALGGLRVSNGAGSSSALSSGVLTIALDAAQVWLQGNTLAPTAGVDFSGATSVKPFEHRTSDPTCTSIDGRVWYRTDTDAYKACANDTVVSLSGGGSSVSKVAIEKTWMTAACDSGGGNVPSRTAEITDENGSTAPTAAGCTGDYGAGLNFSNSATNTIVLRYRLPDNWSSGDAMTLRLYGWPGSGSGSVRMTAETKCSAVGENWVDEGTYNSAQNSDTISWDGTNNQKMFTVSSLTPTGCAAGEILHIRVRRDNTVGSNLAAVARIDAANLKLKVTLE